MKYLEGKFAVVTGASSGIGKATTKMLLEGGMKVVGLARRVHLIEEMRENYEDRLFALRVDLTKQQEILDAFKWIEEHLGVIHVLINNAGVNPNQPVDNADSIYWKTILDTNVLSLAVCTREAIRSMKAYNVHGIIINVNSVAGHYLIDCPGISMYQASKFAVTAFTESIRLELANEGSKIKITSLSPGVVETEMAVEHLGKRNMLQSEEVADAVKYILSQPENVHVSELIIRATGERF